MAKLQLKTTGLQERVVELKCGLNRLGRAPECDVQLDHPTVSAMHCEVLLGCGPVSVRDCHSTNGTFLDGTPVENARLLPGQTLRLGDVELLVNDIEVPVFIPKFEVPVDAPPVVLTDGSVICRRHRASQVTYRCQQCRELLCEHCLHLLRRRGGKLLRLCPLCSYPAELIVDEKKKRKSFIARLKETTRLLFNRATGTFR